MLNTTIGEQKVIVTGKWKKTYQIQTSIDHREMTAMEKHFHVPLSVNKRELFISNQT